MSIEEKDDYITQQREKVWDTICRKEIPKVLKSPRSSKDLEAR
jgi:hypothetical protein